MVALVTLQSQKPDHVAAAILEEIKAGAKQLSGRLPGIVCAHILYMTPSQLRALREERPNKTTEFQQVLNEFFAAEHSVLALRFTTPGDIVKSDGTLGNVRTRTARQSGPVYTATNAAHPLASDTRMKVFMGRFSDS